MNSKMTNSQLSATEPTKNKNKPSKQLEQEQSHNCKQLNLKKQNKQTEQTTRTGTESQKWRSHGGLSVGRMVEKVQGIRNMNGRYKIDRGRLRIVWEMQKPKNLYIQPKDMK